MKNPTSFGSDPVVDVNEAREQVAYNRFLQRGNGLNEFPGGIKDVIARGPWLDVRSFKARPDDPEHDDTEALQAAANEMTNTSRLFMPDGDYLISGSGNECVRFDYSGLVIGESLHGVKIKLADAQTVATMFRTYATNTLEFIQFENLSFDGNKANQSGDQAQHALYLDAVLGGSLRNIYAHDVYDNYPTSIEGTGISVVDSVDVALDYCFAEDMDGLGIYLGNVSSSVLRASLSNCFAKGCGTHGINGWNVKGVSLSNCWGYSNVAAGLMFEDCHSISILGGGGYLNGTMGCWINETSDSIVVGGQYLDNGDYGIGVYGTSGYVANDNVISNNRCKDTRSGGSRTQDYGIYEGVYADGNMFDGNNTKGNINPDIYLSGGASRCHHNKTDVSVQLASAATVTLPNTRDFIRITGTTNITSITASWEGRRVVLKFADVLTVVDGGNLKIAGNFITSADDTLPLVSDGTYWYEDGSRSVN